MSSSCSESVLTNILGGVLGVGTSPNSVGPVMNLKIGKILHFFLTLNGNLGER